MKRILFVAAICFLGGALAESDEDASNEISDEELVEKIRDILKLLSSAETNQDDEDEEASPRGLLTKFNQHCDCAGQNNCGCCGKVDAMGAKMNACFNVSVVANEYALRVKGQLGGFLNIIDEKVSIKKLERACKRLPIFSKVKLCLHTKTDLMEKEGDFKTCMAVEVEAFGKTVSHVKFRCLTYIDSKLSAIDEVMELDPSQDPAVSVESPNPLQAIFDLIKKAKEESNKE